MAYTGQNPREINPNEFSERDRHMANALLENARSGRPVSAKGILRLAYLEDQGSTQQAPYFLQAIGAFHSVELEIDLPRGESGLVNKHDYDNAHGTLMRWQGIVNAA